MKANINNFPKATIILRGYNYEQTRTIVEILSNSKIKSVEVALKSPEVKGILEKIVDEFGDKMLIGAGTVLNKQSLLDVINIGVKFALSPVTMSKEMLEICQEKNIISVPGAYSPTEIYESFQNGADIVKIFPANIVTPKFFKDIKAPLGDLKLMAVGGVNDNNAAEYFRNGADFLGIGSGIFNNEDILQGNYVKLEERVRALEAVLQL